LDETLRSRVLALASLTTPGHEDEAADLLRLLPEFGDATNERLHVVARWTGRLCTGNYWWNSLEPDPVAEHLVAKIATGTDLPERLLALAPADRATRALPVFARASGDEPALAVAVGKAVSKAFPGSSNTP
jgi:hypothetical protein